MVYDFLVNFKSNLIEEFEELGIFKLYNKMYIYSWF